MNQTEVKPQELILALSKGRIFEETMPLLKEAGITVLEDPEQATGPRDHRPCNRRSDLCPVWRG